MYVKRKRDGLRQFFAAAAFCAKKVMMITLTPALPAHNVEH
jgi:hypothetical protein